MTSTPPSTGAAPGASSGTGSRTASASTGCCPSPSPTWTSPPRPRCSTRFSARLAHGVFGYTDWRHDDFLSAMRALVREPLRHRDRHRPARATGRPCSTSSRSCCGCGPSRATAWSSTPRRTTASCKAIIGPRAGAARGAGRRHGGAGAAARPRRTARCSCSARPTIRPAGCGREAELARVRPRLAARVRRRGHQRRDPRRLRTPRLRAGRAAPSAVDAVRDGPLGADHLRAPRPSTSRR